jgi:hypothetical protein
MDLLRQIILITTKLAALSLLLLASSSFPQGRRGQQQPSVFHTEVPAHPIDVILARPAGTTMTLSILAYKDMEGVIACGAQKGSYPYKTEIIELKKGVPANVVLSALSTNTRYYYRLDYREPGEPKFVPGKECSFHTARPAGSPFTFAVQADSHLDENASPQVYARTLANALAGRPDFLVDLGDTFMTDKVRPNYRDAFKMYLAQRYYFGLLCKSAPLFLVLGSTDTYRGTS